METVYVLVHFFVLVLAAEARIRNQTSCDTFTCGNLDFRFPFYNIFMPSRCGLFKMNCSDEIPEIQLEEEGQWYKVKSVSQTNTLTVTDPRLNQSLITGNCSDLSSFSLPNSPWLDLTTLYKCNGSRKNGFTYANCGEGGSSFYYSNLEDELSCSAIKTPANWVIPRHKNQANVTATFSLQINLPQGCFRCHNQGGDCKMIKDKYRCVGATTEDAGKSPPKLKIILGISSGLAMMILIAIVVTVRATNRTKSDWNGKKIEAVVMLKRFSYVQVKKMTKSFADVLGKGGFGTVYKGKLSDGSRDVAVKILKESNEDGEEFINELASMSRTSHVNIVSLLGFCYERTKKAIIYEYMPNGSLDKFIAEKMSTKMEWKMLYNIAVGVSRGLEYLHNHCVSRIVHFDIKPQNILMDGDFCPKISDFGLAKLCKNNESIMSMLDARGTVGYIAPEVFSKNFGGVSHKSDVYSYGMVVLEMIGARNIERVQNAGSNNTSMYFPDWIYTDLEKGDIMSFLSDQVTEEEDEKIVKKMVLVGLWCIQTNPYDRPPMDKVVEMLEGSLEALQIPPKPVLCLPTITFQNSVDAIQEASSFSKPRQDTSHYTEEAVQDIA